MNILDLARRYFGAFAAKDSALLRELLADDVSLRDWTVSVSGRDAVLAEMERGFQTLARIAVEPTAVYRDGSVVLAELLIDLDDEQIKVLDVLVFDARSKISEIRAYKG